MKQIFTFFIIVACFLNCSSPKLAFIEDENQILMTKKFIGRYDTSYIQDNNYTKVYTTKEVINVRLEGDTIPNNAFCYIQLKSFDVAGQLSKRYRVFFTWYGTENYYFIDEDKLAVK